MELREQRPDRCITVVHKHQFLHEFSIGKDAAFQPGVPKIKAKRCGTHVNPQI
jgi:hypothetical protein